MGKGLFLGDGVGKDNVVGGGRGLFFFFGGRDNSVWVYRDKSMTTPPPPDPPSSFHTEGTSREVLLHVNHTAKVLSSTNYIKSPSINTPPSPLSLLYIVLNVLL